MPGALIVGETAVVALAKELLEAALGRSFDNVRWLLEDVGDEDCFWEPSTPCWSVRPREAASTGWGTGEWVCEDTWPPPDPLPITSIAWRIAHLAAWTDIYRNWTFEDQSLGLRQFDVPGRRDELVAWLVLAQNLFSEAVGALEEPDVVALRPAHWGPKLPVHQLVSTIAVEHTHHGAEIGLLRDIHRGHARVQPPPR